MSCAAYGCRNRPSHKVEGITFHRFPADVNRRQQWILAVRRANWVPTNGSLLCSTHFPEEMFDRCSTMRVRLKPDAIPTIFKGFPPHIAQELDSLKPKAELKTLYPLPVKQEPPELTPDNTHIKTEPFSNSDKNRILVIPGDLDILSKFSSSNGNTKDQKHVLIISNDTDIKTILNNEDDNDENRVIIVSDGTNGHSEWYGNTGEDSFDNGMVTLDDDTNIKTETLNESIEDSSYNNPLLLHNSEFYIERVKELEEKMVNLRKKLKALHQTSRRNKKRIIRFKKKVSRLNRFSRPRPRRAQPILHLIDCDQ